MSYLPGKIGVGVFRDGKPLFLGQFRNQAIDKASGFDDLIS
jgi:hypothetical protein